MGKIYVNEPENLSFTLISDDLKFSNITTPLLDFRDKSKTLIFKSDSEIKSFDIDRPFDEIIEKDALAFRISSKNLIFINISTALPSFQISSREPNYINNSKVLSYALHDYDQSIPIFQILLEFFNETGGVF